MIRSYFLQSINFTTLTGHTNNALLKPITIIEYSQDSVPSKMKGEEEVSREKQQLCNKVAAPEGKKDTKF